MSSVTTRPLTVNDIKVIICDLFDNCICFVHAEQRNVDGEGKEKAKSFGSAVHNKAKKI